MIAPGTGLVPGDFPRGLIVSLWVSLPSVAWIISVVTEVGTEPEIGNAGEG